MFSKIVLALDGSDPSGRAIPVAEALAKQSGGRIDVAYVREIVGGRGGVHTVHVDEDTLEQKVEGQVAALSDAGIATELHRYTANVGGPAHQIAELAEQLGADLTIPGGEGAIERVREATQGRGADVVIETTGVLPSVASAIHMVRSGGRVLLFGILTVKEGALPFYDLYFKEIALISARVAKSEDYPAAIALVESGQVRLEPLVSNVMPLEEAKAAVAMLGSDSGPRMKVILEHG